MTTLRFQNQFVLIDAGELVSYQVDGHEYIHQKGSPGWRNADTEMFPIIGPTADAGFFVQTPKDIAVLDQHGLLRELEYAQISATETEAVFKKTYVARTPVENSKYPEKSTKKQLFWPYDFHFEKAFHLNSDGLQVRFKIAGERDSPFMLGYHPAFKLHTTEVTITSNEKNISLEEVLAVGGRALHVPACEELILRDAKQLKIRTEGFGDFMLWTEVPNMVCIEPITFYPYSVPQQAMHEGFDYLLDGPREFAVHISTLD